MSFARHTSSAAAPAATKPAKMPTEMPKAEKPAATKPVQLTARLSHRDWKTISKYAIDRELSINTLIKMGLSQLMQNDGLPPLKDIETL